MFIWLESLKLLWHFGVSSGFAHEGFSEEILVFILQILPLFLFEQLRQVFWGQLLNLRHNFEFFEFMNSMEWILRLFKKDESDYL